MHVVIYLIYWIRTMKPLFGKRAFCRFYRANGWIHKYLENSKPKSPLSSSIISSAIQFIFELIYTILLGPLWEVFLRRWQLKRARSKKAQLSDSSGIVISKTMLKFHNIDRRKEIFDRWHRSIKQRWEYYSFFRVFNSIFRAVPVNPYSFLSSFSRNRT